MASNSSDAVKPYAQLASASLIAEARLTPKPGLVDSHDAGAHTDMDLTTFLESAAALEPSFERYVERGEQLGPSDADALSSEMRRIGIRAEAAMFAATDGINTHKGANFTFALVLGALGALEGTRCTEETPDKRTWRILKLVSSMAEGLLDRDVRDLHRRVRAGTVALTHGERLLLERGIQGVRGEAARGYPLLGDVALPYLRAAAPRAAGPTQARMLLLRCLVKIMAVLEDTNVVHRGGTEALADHRAYCRALDAADLSDDELLRALASYNEELIARNVSPGGAADLLSLAIFFALTEDLLAPQDLTY